MTQEASARWWGMRSPRLVALLLVVPSLAALAATSPAHAAAPTCDGKAANLVGTAGNDTNDTLTGTPNPLGNVVWLGGGNDTYSGGTGNDTICGGDGDDTIDGGAGNDVVDGGAGNDYLVGEAGNDKIIGGGGSDRLSYTHSTAGVTVHGATGTASGAVDGSDTFTGVEKILGTPYADTMTGGDESDWFEGRGGNDYLSGGGGVDFLFATSGKAFGGPGDDLVAMGGGVGHGGGGNDTMRIRNQGIGYGDGGNDLFYMGRATPVGYGGAGNDEFAMRSINFGSRLFGGKGVNALTFHGFKVGIKANLAKGTASWSGHTLHFAEVSSLRGTGHDDVLTGSAGPDFIWGNPGNDTINGGGGNDILVGGSDRDSANGGAGADVCSAEVIRACEAA